MSRVHCAVLNARPLRFPTGGVSTCSQSYGGHGERETPGNIPNPEAKPLSADGTALETGWESRTPPDNHYRTGVRATCSDPRFAFVSGHAVGVPPMSAANSKRYRQHMTSPRRGSDGARDDRGSGSGRGSTGQGKGGTPRGTTSGR